MTEPDLGILIHRGNHDLAELRTSHDCSLNCMNNRDTLFLPNDAVNEVKPLHVQYSSRHHGDHNGKPIAIHPSKTAMYLHMCIQTTVLVSVSRT